MGSAWDASPCLDLDGGPRPGLGAHMPACVVCVQADGGGCLGCLLSGGCFRASAFGRLLLGGCFLAVAFWRLLSGGCFRAPALGFCFRASAFGRLSRVAASRAHPPRPPTRAPPPHTPRPLRSGWLRPSGSPAASGGHAAHAPSCPKRTGCAPSPTAPCRQRVPPAGNTGAGSAPRSAGTGGCALSAPPC